MTDNTFKPHTFVLKEDGKIYYVPDMPKKPIYGKWHYDDAENLKKDLAYREAIKTAIANGVEVENQDDVLCAIGNKLEHNELYTLNCWVKKDINYIPIGRGLHYKIEGDDTLRQADLVSGGIGYMAKEIARVTFEQPEKRNPEPEAAGQEQELLWFEFLYDIGSRRHLLAGEEGPERWQEMKAFLTEKYNVVITRKHSKS